MYEIFSQDTPHKIRRVHLRQSVSSISRIGLETWRTLAQRSAAAAKDIKSLIDASGEKVRNGNMLVQETQRTMEEIGRAVRTMATTMNEITLASQEQTDGIAQLNQLTPHVMPPAVIRVRTTACRLPFPFSRSLPDGYNAALPRRRSPLAADMTLAPTSRRT